MQTLFIAQILDTMGSWVSKSGTTATSDKSGGVHSNQIIIAKFTSVSGINNYFS